MADEAAWARLVDWVRHHVHAAGDRPLILGMVGLPGCGKSTLAARLLGELALPRSLSVSLDDFYLTAEQRRPRGLIWRGPPGAHELPLLDRFLTQLTSAAAQVEVPVFDRENERRLPARTVPGPLSMCIIEGWFVGARSPGYEPLANALDRLIYLDMDTATARAARLTREAVLRNRGLGGMSDTAVARFWDEAIAPHIATLVLPLRDRADACLALDPAHRITALTFR
jgi:pantothenate kinase-related protein Tda10